MAERPGSRRDFDRMIARHHATGGQARADFERTWRDLEEQMAKLRRAMAAAREEFLRVIARDDAPLDSARKSSDLSSHWPKALKRRRPPPPRPSSRRRGSEGGEPVPVEPRPKPKPLVDGAEAPIE